MANDYSGMALVFAIIALFGFILTAGYVYVNNQGVDLTPIQSQLDQQSNAINSNANAIAQLNTATQSSVSSLEAQIAQVNTNRYYGGDYDSEINDLEDVWDCLDDFAVDEDFNDLEDCLDDI